MDSTVKTGANQLGAPSDCIYFPLLFFTGGKIQKEFEYITELIERCNIPIELTHWDCDPKNMIYDTESGLLTLVDYENLDTQILPTTLEDILLATWESRLTFLNSPMRQD